MTALLKRLNALDTNQTPQQIIVRQLQRINQCQSVDEWLSTLYGEPFSSECEQNGIRLKEQIRKKEKNKVLQLEARQKASRELVYLYTLLIWPIQHLEQNRYRYLFEYSSLIILQLRTLIPPNKKSQPAFDAFCPIWEKLYIELVSVQMTEQLLRERYFNGQSLFLDEHRTFLANQLEKLEILHEIFEERLILTNPSQEVIEAFDKNRLATVAKTDAKRRFECAGREAKLAVYDFEGRTEEIRETYEQFFKEMRGSYANSQKATVSH